MPGGRDRTGKDLDVEGMWLLRNYKQFSIAGAGGHRRIGNVKDLKRWAGARSGRFLCLCSGVQV